MNDKININTTILSGADLRVLLNSDHISYGEIHLTLKEKGIFVGNSDKAVTVPLLSATLLTPDNFSKLIESSVNRETRPKNKVIGLDLATEDADWISPLRDSLFADEFNPISSIGNADFATSPDIVIEGTTKLRIPYTITRKDFSKDWLQRELQFEAEILIERQGRSLKLDFSSTHSSQETELINTKIISRISSILHSHHITSNQTPKQITFGSFSNEERIRFFKRLTAEHQPCFSAGSVNDIEISKDQAAPPLPDEPQVAWMNHSVKRIKVDGDRLNDIFLIADERYYSYYHILRMDVIYPYTQGANKGECRISYTFSPPTRREADIKNTELTFECTRITYDNTVNQESKKTISSFISKSVRALVENKFQQIIDERLH